MKDSTLTSMLIKLSAKRYFMSVFMNVITLDMKMRVSFVKSFVERHFVEILYDSFKDIFTKYFISA